MKRKRSVFDMEIDDEIIDAKNRISPLLRYNGDDTMVLDAMDCDDTMVLAAVAAVDRISSLPDPLLHHIMSYLPTKDAAKTIALSRRWQLASSTFPILDFDQTLFQNHLRETRTMFISYVNRSLQRFCQSGLSIQKLRFRLHSIDYLLAYFVNEWIEMSMENHVKEIDIIHLQKAKSATLNFFAPAKVVELSLPQTVFASKSITTIKLHGCKLEPHFLSRDTIRFKSIRELSFKEVHLDDQMTEKLIAACPFIEAFSIVDCSGLERLKICKVLKLKKVEVNHHLGGLEKIDMEEASSLESFVCWQISKPCVLNIVKCQYLKGLKLIANVVNDDFFHDLTAKFPLLETLHIGCNSDLKRLMISSSKLKKLVLDACMNLVDVHINTPNLIWLHYYGCTIPLSSLMNPSCVWTISIHLGSDAPLNTLWFLKLKAFLAKSNQVRSLQLSIPSHKNEFNLEELIGTSLPPNCEVGHLYVKLPYSKSDPAALVDGLLWSCRPKSLDIAPLSEIRMKFIDYLGKKLMDREVYEHCCSSRHIKCWRHYLEELRMESFNDIWRTLEQGQLHSGVLKWSPHVLGVGDL